MNVGTKVRINGALILPENQGVYTGRDGDMYRVFCRSTNVMMKLYRNEFEVIG